MKRSSILWICCLILLLNSCSQVEQTKMPGINVPLDEMNKDLVVVIPQRSGRLEINNMITLAFENHSKTHIILPPNYGVHIFQNINEKWQIVENRFTYPPGEIHVFPIDDRSTDLVTFIFPVVSSDQPVKMRVVVEGNYYDETNGKKGKLVGAYTDFTLEP